MILPSLLAAAVSSGPSVPPSRLDPLELFLQADIVVQLVMAGLLLASIWVWAIIVSFSMRVRQMHDRNLRFEKGFWRADDVDGYLGKHGDDAPSARVAAAGMDEWRRSTDGALNGGTIDREGTRARVANALDAAVTAESDALAEKLNFLATVGSVAPFVGLFGTVWGIMNSFFQIGAQSSTSLAVVAPGISEALFATAIGLFAAIPAVIAYNRFSHRVNSFETRLYRFSDRLHASLSRELDTVA